MRYGPAYWIDRHQRQGDHYVARGGREKSWKEQRSAFGDFIARNIARHRRAPTLALDFGCGPGRFADIIAANADEYLGVDIIPQAMRNNPFPTSAEIPERFDALVAVVVFQHIHDDAVIEELGARLDPGGIAIIIDQTEEPNPGPHMCYRTPERVAELLGVDILTTRTRQKGELLGCWARVMQKPGFTPA